MPQSFVGYFYIIHILVFFNLGFEYLIAGHGLNTVKGKAEASLKVHGSPASEEMKLPESDEVAIASGN